MDGVTQKLIELGGGEVIVPDAWYDITDEVEADDPPYTLAEPDKGIGALQLSIALYQGGVAPAPSQDDLRNMALRFGEQRGLDEAFEEQVFMNESLRGAAMSFRWEEDFIRIWYVSDGRSIAFVTYVCEWGEQNRELSTCEDIVKSLRFGPR
ncbi:hypothetical protein DC522_10930 [Microvirga sp. KLBC 81]|uniref:hypothetical protein n=1 Tax=Microvirga sp. KLBC 81 TaxID=1862707 RepID=UPI000D52571D|nr:hypothetical protein [Microvirga sp. KLBC 81]PVE24374.1 hypothetical protein DC522_10930 [Microvirga sp. KLBC 81]